VAAEGIRDQGRAVAALPLLLFASLALAGLEGCASHSERTLPVRTALDEGAPREAIRLLNEQMEVKSDADQPTDLSSDAALWLLDRASVQQAVTQFDLSRRDFEVADKAIDMLDLAHDARDSIGEYVFSGSSGKYQAPPYEKLLVNTLDMVNYLEKHDLEGARVEARRLAVMQRYVGDDLHERDDAVLGLGAFLAGLTFEKSDRADEALHWYADAARFAPFKSMAPASLERTDDGQGEIVLLVGYGRVPHKIANRIPIGLALTLYADALSPDNVEQANRLAAQGLVTWINFPTLGPEQGGFAVPSCVIDDRALELAEAVNVSHDVRAEWSKIEGKIIVSAITRLIARFVAGEAARAAAGRNEGLGLLLSLGTQATLTALDTPDTRSWETLPARFAVARMRVAPGKHHVRLDARGVSRTVDVDVERGGWSFVSLMALR
jgi:uncharacterized protein